MSKQKLDKQILLDAIIDQFQAEFELLSRAARTTYEAATHEENRAENKYDTRGLEASYLAESQSKRARELQKTVNIYRSLKLRHFGAGEAIAMTALVTLGDGPEIRTYFIGPQGGGAQVTIEQTRVQVITPASPLGRSLLGLEMGDTVAVGPEGTQREFEIVLTC